MPEIVRGKTFDPNQQITASDLDELVRNAVITGLSLDAVGAGFIGSSGVTRYTNASGWLFYSYVNPTGSTQASGNGGDAMLMLNSIHGQVACFMNGGLETRRFVASHGANWQYHNWGGPYFIDTPSGSVTLTCGFASGSDAFGNPAILGTNARFTASTSPTDPSGQPQIVIQGLTPLKSVSTAPSGFVPRFVYGGAALTAHWAATQHTSVDKIWGLVMTAAAGGDLLYGAWLWGAPVWRI